MDATIKGLQEFMEQFPDSALIPDAKKTLDLLREERDTSIYSNSILILGLPRGFEKNGMCP